MLLFPIDVTMGNIYRSSLKESEREVAQSCPILCDPMDYSLPGFAIHGIFQARVLELGCYCLLRQARLVTWKREHIRVEGPHEDS